jgi:Ala-tRNA(Pro) deacylase
MPILKRLEEYLKKNDAKYKEIAHPEVYTSQEVAAAMHISGKDLAKPVMIKADGSFVMAVLPASLKVDFKKLKEILMKKDVRLATEDEFKDLFPDCDPGAEPPFGNLYSVDTVVDRRLTADEHIFFNAGTHYQAVEMDYKDFARLVKPRVEDFAAH